MPFLPRNPEHHTADVIALHRATLEHPFDDTPHLVYADAMDDVGAHEEAHTLRRLVKLRAAIGDRAVQSSHYGTEPGKLRGKVLTTNTARITTTMRDKDRSGPHIRLSDAEQATSSSRYGRSKIVHRERTLRFVPETGGAAVTYQIISNWYMPHGRTPVGSNDYGHHRDFIHSDTVKHLLGEPDAQ